MSVPAEMHPPDYSCTVVSFTDYRDEKYLKGRPSYGGLLPGCGARMAGVSLWLTVLPWLRGLCVDQ